LILIKHPSLPIFDWERVVREILERTNMLFTNKNKGVPFMLFEKEKLGAQNYLRNLINFLK
jgi:hypothetical protein